MNFTSLFHLFISGPFPHECHSVCKRCYFHHLSHVLEADCSESNLTKLPLFLPESINLLNLSVNLIENIEKQFTDRFGQISFLDMSHNKLVSLPTSIQNMTQLSQLNISHNHLTYISPSIKNMNSLTHLDISHNQLTSISPSIKNMKSLTHLDLSYNQLTTLPKFLQKMGSLKEIRISPNKYVCSCELKWLWKWKSNPTVPDWRMTSCKMDSGESIVIFDINETAMGCNENTAYQLQEILNGKRFSSVT